MVLCRWVGCGVNGNGGGVSEDWVSVCGGAAFAAPGGLVKKSSERIKCVLHLRSGTESSRALSEALNAPGSLPDLDALTVSKKKKKKPRQGCSFQPRSYFQGCLILCYRDRQHHRRKTDQI
jgi:hypothetical protein